MDGAVLQFIDTMGSTTISAGLYEISATGSGCNCDIRNSVIRGPAAGASTRIYFDFSDTNHTLNFTGNLVVDAGTIQFASGQTATGNTFDDCLLITHGGADMTSCTVKNYEGTAGTAALLYNVNADPDGEMDDMTFIKGTAATHAIELGSSCPSSITLRGLTVSGYNTSDGQNDSVIYNNSGKAITVNIANNTGAITYRNGTSASTTIATDPATTTITVKDIDDMSAIENARVLLLAADATGDFPYEETVTIVRAGSVATVTHTGHGMATGDIAYISGATQNEYNGAFEITVTTANAYTYNVPGLPTTPATGTIKSTGGIFNHLTNSSGIVTDTRSWTNDQPFIGRVRKGSTPKYYNTAPLAGTIDTSAGYTTTIFMLPD